MSEEDPIESLCLGIDAVGLSLRLTIEALDGEEEVDGRWLNIAKTDLQKGLMALRRAIYNDDTF